MHRINNKGETDNSLNIVPGCAKQDIILFLIKEYGANYNATIDNTFEYCHKKIKISISTTLKISIWKTISISLSIPIVIKYASTSKHEPKPPSTHQQTT